jgi:hypothetical protein
MANLDFNAEPYWDDFQATNGALENNYMRILFRPGYAVQARELTQIQSIIQNQIQQFGNHIFQDGSPVVGGHLTLDTSAFYVKLDKQYQGVDIDLEDFLGKTVMNNLTPKTRARVVQTFSNATDRALIVKYLRGADFLASQTLVTAGAENIATATILSSAFTGAASTVSINDGVFYVGGFFVKVSPQTIVLEAYSSTPTYRVGLQIEEDIVTESDDTMLLDPAQESFNYQAPGAHRYKYNLVLSKRALDSVDDSRFFELLRVENGVVTKQVNYPIYSELEKTLARRTYDESGNYVVKPFRVSVSANTPLNNATANSTFLINIEPGKAYVKGFEYETISSQKFSANRARTYNTNIDYNLSAYYGNSLRLTDVLGSNTAGIMFGRVGEEVDIHCVSNNQISLTGSSEKYYATRIGTARVKDVENGGAVGQFDFFFIDTNFTPILGVTPNQDPTSFKKVFFPAHFTASSNSYVGGTLTILDGDAAGESQLISSYDGTTKFALVDVNFSSAITTGTKFSLTLPFAAAESISVANTSTFTTANLQANVSSQSKTKVGDAYLQDTNFNKNIFELANDHVKRDGYANFTMYRRYFVGNQLFNGTSNGSFSLTLSTGDIFDFGSNGALVSNAEILENLMVVVTNSTNSSNGKIIDLTTASRSVKKISPTQIEIYTNSFGGTSFYADVYITTKNINVGGGGPGSARSKTLVSSNAALTVNDTLASATDVVGYTAVKLNAANGIAYFTSNTVINKTPGEKQSLFISDVIRINKVYDSANVFHVPNTVNMIDITDRYTFDSGQNDNYYDHSAIILKPGANPPTGQTAVLFDRFSHGGGSAYLSGGSYSSTLYDNNQIPFYKSISGKLYNLRDCIDMRPIRDAGTVTAPYITSPLTPTINIGTTNLYLVSANTNKTSNAISPPITTGSIISIGSPAQYRRVANVVNTTAVIVATPFVFGSNQTDLAINVVRDNKLINFGNTTSTWLQRPSDPIELDYQYYLPRIDKIVVTKDKEFKILTGVPGLNPQEPVENENAMPIYRINIPAYTASPEEIDLHYIDNRRYTMKDISVIDERLSNLEEYVRLKDSEADIIANPPKDSTGYADKPILGTLVDEYNDLASADTVNDFSASIENGMLTAYKHITPFDLVPVDKNDATIHDKIVSLQYTEVSAVTQGFSTNNANSTVQTAVIGKFEGFVTLTPESDYFYSSVHQPAVTDNLGRDWQIAHGTVNTRPTFTSTYLNLTYLGQYNLLYNNAYILGQNNPLSMLERTISIPDFTCDPTVTEPASTVDVPITTTGVADVLNSQWHGSSTLTGSINIGGFAGGYGFGWLDNLQKK